MAEGRILTFYSYTGGTGRTMALANVATLLARQGAVLMIDWNLEAPALHRYFPETGAGQAPGLIDLFESLAANPDTDPAPFVQQTRWENLCLLPAGRFDESYAARVAGFAWRALDERQPGLIQNLAAWWRGRYRYVLIDSRSGVNEMSGMCAMMLPDQLVMLFTPAGASLDGTIEVARLAHGYRYGEEPTRPFVVLPVPSRGDGAETARAARWRFGPDPAGYEERWEAVFRELFGLSACHLHAYFNACALPHQPRYCFGEALAAAGEDEAHPTPLGRAYAELARRIASAAPAWAPADEASGCVEVDGEWLAPREAEARLLARIPQCMAQRDSDRLARTLQQLAGLEARAGHTAEARAYFQQALALLRTLAAPDPLASLLEDLGRFELAQERAEEAWRCLSEALTLAGETLPPIRRARLLVALGDAERALPRGDAARTHYQEALAIYEADSDRLGTALVCEKLATLDSASNPERAETEFRRAAGIFELERETGRLAACLRALGDLQRRHGRFEDAAREYRRCLEMLPGNGYAGERARTLLGLARIGRGQSNPAEAELRYREALDLFLERGEQDGAAAAREGLAELALRRGDLEAAVREYEEALAAATLANNPRRLASVSLGLGEAARRRGDQEGARRRFTQALETYRSLYHSVGQANALLSLAELDRQTGAAAEARDRICQALQIYRQLRAGAGEANALKSLGDLEASAGAPGLARELYLEAAAAYEAQRNQLGLANVYQKLGDLERGRRRFTAASDWYARARELYERNGLPAGLAYTYSELARVSHALCDFAASIAYLHEAEAAAARSPSPDVRGYVWSVREELRAGKV